MGGFSAFLALAAGPDFKHFWTLLLLGVVCFLRGVQIYQDRKSILNKTQVIVLTDKQRKKPEAEQPVQPKPQMPLKDTHSLERPVPSQSLNRPVS